MAKRIYVGNLPYSVTEDELNQIFSRVGEVASARIVKDQASGRSKGFGFVEMTSDQDADRAIAELNGTSVMNRAIVVSEAKPMTERGGPGRGPGQRTRGMADRSGGRTGWRF